MEEMKIKQPRAIVPLEIKVGRKEKVTIEDKNWGAALEWILVYSRKNEPAVQTMLMCVTDFEEVKKDPVTTRGMALAYTYYTGKRMKIALDFDRIGGTCDEPGYILFMIYHEFMHNLLQHFTRKTITYYQKQDPQLTNVIIDYYCNVAALDMARMQENKVKELVKKTYSLDGLNTEEEIEGFGMIGEQEIRELAKKFEVELPKGDLRDSVEEELLELFFNSQKYKDYKAGEEKLVNYIKGLLDKINGDHEAFDEALDKMAKETGADKESLKDLMQARLSSDFEESMRNAGGSNAGTVGRHVNRNRKKIDILNTFKIKTTIGKRLKKDTKRTYSKPFRKYELDFEVMRKGKLKLKGDKLIVGIDVSGSVSQQDLEKIYAICDGYLSKNQGELEVVFWSSCEIVPERDVIESVTNYKEMQRHKVYSSGGTVVGYLLDYLNNKFKTKEKVSLVMISDFYFSEYPEYPECVKDSFNLAVCEEGFKIAKKHYPKSHNVLVRE